jgi:hypothetical protein
MPAQLAICFLPREAPPQSVPVSVAMALPSGNLAGQDHRVGDAPSQMNMAQLCTCCIIYGLRY